MLLGSTFHLQQAVLCHGVHNDDALAFAVSAHFVCCSRGEAEPEELRAVMRMNVALIHVYDDRRAVLLLLQRLGVLLNVVADERVAVGRIAVDEVFLAVLIA